MDPLIVAEILIISIMLAHLTYFIDIIIDANEMKIKLTKKQIWNIWINNRFHGKSIYKQLYRIKVIDKIKNIKH